MDEIKKKPEEEKSEPETPKAEEKPAETPPKAEEPKPEKAEDKPSDDKQAEETAENAEAPEPKEEEAPSAPVKDEKDEEILRLKTQIEAMKLGVSGDCLNDAVAIAESYVRSGTAGDISTALSQVVKKYPAMKSDSKDEKKGGFKVGADSSPKDEKKNDDRISNAFGIKKK